MKERFNEAFNYLKGQGVIKTQRDAALKIGMAEGNLSHALKGNERYLTQSFIERFNEAFANIFNISWLLTGEGAMLKTEAAALQMLDAIEAANEDNKIPRKQIDIDAIDFQNTVIIRLKKEAEEKDAVIDKLKVTIVEKETEIKTLKETMKMLFETK